MINLLKNFNTHFHKYLTPTQIQTLSILIGLINQYRQIKIEKLATYFPLPILFESRRKHIQRFLVLKQLSISLIWFPIIKQIITQKFPINSELIIALDRTQWKDKNIFVISVMYYGHGLPIYWQILNKKGASNLGEQKALIKPVLKLLNQYNIIIIGDREFHSIELATWLKKEKNKRRQKIDFVLRQKKGTYYHKGGKKYQKMSDIEVLRGIKQMKIGIKVTKKKGFSRNNLAIYHKRRRNNKGNNEPWYILTSLDNVQKVIKIYEKRMGIETMFKDYKKGGYNLEESKANTTRLTNLILLIAIAYTHQTLKGEIIKKKGIQKYIGLRCEKKRKTKRNSNFWIGLYGKIWIYNYDKYEEEINQIMNLNKNKLSFYYLGLKVKDKMEKIYNM